MPKKKNPADKTDKPAKPKQHLNKTGKFHVDRHATLIKASPESAGKADDLLNTDEVAEWLRVSHIWLAIRRGKGGGPKFVTVGTKIRYRRDAVWEWLSEREYSHTNQYRAKEEA